MNTRFFGWALLVIPFLVGGCASSTTKTTTEVSDVDAAKVNVRLGWGYYQQGNLILAREKLERALEQDPKLPDAHAAIAMLYDQIGETAEANKHFRTALRISPDDPSLRNTYGVFLCAQDKYQDAEENFLDAAQNPMYLTPAVAYTNAGVCARNNEKDELAEQYFRAALQADPRFPDALSQMTDLQFINKQYLPARAFLERYLDSAGATPSMLWLGVQIERALEDEQAARGYAQRLKSEFPESYQNRLLVESEREDGST